MKIEAPRGTHDVLPSEQPLWQWVTGEVEQLCADPEVDAIYVATPHQYHAPHTIMAASFAEAIVSMPTLMP